MQTNLIWWTLKNWVVGWCNQPDSVLDQLQLLAALHPQMWGHTTHQANKYIVYDSQGIEISPPANNQYLSRPAETKKKPRLFFWHLWKSDPGVNLKIPLRLPVQDGSQNPSMVHPQ
jgi:hypothetical protein